MLQNNKGASAMPATDDLAVVRKPLPHDSAPRHVTGSAAYIDDIRSPPERCIWRPAMRRSRAAASPASTSKRCGPFRASSPC